MGEIPGGENKSAQEIAGETIDLGALAGAELAETLEDKLVEKFGEGVFDTLAALDDISKADSSVIQQTRVVVQEYLSECDDVLPPYIPKNTFIEEIRKFVLKCSKDKSDGVDGGREGSRLIMHVWNE